MRKILILFILTFAAISLYSQSVEIATYGRSPRQVEGDTTDIFNLPYNGLTNVGANTQLYLEANLTGTVLNNPEWHVIDKPIGGNDSFGATANLTDSNQVVIFIPDSVGTYKINFTNGSLTSNTLILKVGLYLGYTYSYPILPNHACQDCHSDKTAEWQQTGHFSIFEEGLNGMLGSHYGADCIKCHTTGYDTSAVNNGFDDFPFVFPDTLYPGQYDSLVAEFPQAMLRGRVQCESCHGPGSMHVGAANIMSVSLKAGNCAWCHDEGTRHVIPAQWRITKHALLPDSETRASCAPCHNGEGFVKYIKNGRQPLTNNISNKVPISCAVCHDPHSVQYPHQIRANDVTLENNVEISNVGTGALCMNCHHARHDAVSYTNDYLNNLRYYGPDMGPQADILAGTNAITFGQNIPTSPHLVATENSCATCHMFPASSDSLGNVILVGSHTFSMSDPDGNDNVAACAPCHGNFGPEFSDKKYYVNQNADLDGDGTANGLQIEIQGLLDTLANHLPPLNSLTVTVDSSYTLTQAQAAYDYIMVTSDRSLGVHNPEFTYGILRVSLDAIGVPVGVSNEESSLPHDFSLAQNYPNPFNPATTIQYELPEGSNVKIAVYNALGEQVEVLVDGFKNAGTYQVNFNGTNLASGIYLYRMEAGNFVKVNKMLLLK